MENLILAEECELCLLSWAPEKGTVCLPPSLRGLGAKTVEDLGLSFSFRTMGVLLPPGSFINLDLFVGSPDECLEVTLALLVPQGAFSLVWVIQA